MWPHSWHRALCWEFRGYMLLPGAPCFHTTGMQSHRYAHVRRNSTRTYLLSRQWRWDLRCPVCTYGGFESMGVPLNHPLMGFSSINIQLLGCHHIWKPPYNLSELCQFFNLSELNWFLLSAIVIVVLLVLRLIVMIFLTRIRSISYFIKKKNAQSHQHFRLSRHPFKKLNELCFASFEPF